jgi:hypothetical protein
MERMDRKQRKWMTGFWAAAGAVLAVVGARALAGWMKQRMDITDYVIQTTPPSEPRAIPVTGQPARGAGDSGTKAGQSDYFNAAGMPGEFFPSPGFDSIGDMDGEEPQED